MNAGAVRRLKWKIIMTSTLTFFLVMLVLGASINTANALVTNMSIHRMLDYLVDHDGEPFPNTNQGRQERTHSGTNEEFEETIGRGGLLEYARYGDHYYGTPRDYVEQNLESGNNVILEIEVQGAEQIMKLYPDTVSIFLAAPTAEELEHRLVGRGSESREEITKRLMTGMKEAEKMHLYDYVLINKDLDECVAELDRIVRGDTQDHRYRRSFKERFVKDMERIVKKRTGIGRHKD